MAPKPNTLPVRSQPVNSEVLLQCTQFASSDNLPTLPEPLCLLHIKREHCSLIQPLCWAFWVGVVCLNAGKRQCYLRFSLTAPWAWQTRDRICKICDASVLYRVGRWGWARWGYCVKSVLSNGGCSFEPWSLTLQVLICVLRLFTIIGSLITSSLGKVEIILMKTSERSPTNLFVNTLFLSFSSSTAHGWQVQVYKPRL